MCIKCFVASEEIISEVLMLAVTSPCEKGKFVALVPEPNNNFLRSLIDLVHAPDLSSFVIMIILIDT